jgi:EAL domain-containing protein (putative c-di-GMP-specific phosphodiesterase class I)/GGDEF domain-containing protein
MLQNLFHSKRLLTPRNKPVKEPQRQEMRHPMFQGLRGCSKSSNLVLFAIQDHYLYRELFGEDMVRHIEDQLKDSLISCGADLTSQDDVHCLTSESGEYLLLWPTRDRENLADLAYAIKIKAQDELKRTMLKWTGREVELGIGFARFGADGGGDWEKRFLQAVTEARRSARSHLDISGLEIAARFNELLLNKSVHAFYQPILDFSTGSIMGWEALARGPAGTSFQSPIMLFELAEQLERLFALEELCREKAITNLGEIAPDQRLFLNIHPRTMVDPEFTPGKTLSLLERAGMKPANIVFEITERHSLQDFGLFYRTLEHYRSQGFQVAVDDVGAGYSGLSSIAEIQPDFIKIDMSLVANVDRDPVKRALLETITTFAEKIGSKIIAEGIETRAQAICLLDIGVHYGQGYFLARPAFPRPGLAVDADELRLVGDLSQKSLTCSMPVGNLAEAPHAVSAEFLVSDAQHFFEKNRTFSSLVVTEDDKPKGLIMEYHLNRQLSSQYGVALFYKRPVSSIMDENPLSVDETTPVEQVAKQAMQREHLKAYDDIIVTKRGKLFGVVTVQKIMNTLAHVQVEMAKGTNPLTGLPGNVFLEQEIEARIAKKKSFSLIYADLDHFKVYNDTYGFKNGDRIIKLAADILSWAVKKYGPGDARLCHIGGDDFVILSNTESAEPICRGAIRCFKRLVRGCYCLADRQKGWIQAVGRDGQERQFPLVSMSLGIMEIASKCTLLEIGERAAHIKKFAKSFPGNSYARDRRPPLGSDLETVPAACAD